MIKKDNKAFISRAPKKDRRKEQQHHLSRLFSPLDPFLAHFTLPGPKSSLYYAEPPILKLVEARANAERSILLTALLFHACPRLSSTRGPVRLVAQVRLRSSVGRLPTSKG